MGQGRALPARGRVRLRQGLRADMESAPTVSLPLSPHPLRREPPTEGAKSAQFLVTLTTSLIFFSLATTLFRCSVLVMPTVTLMRARPCSAARAVRE